MIKSMERWDWSLVPEGSRRYLFILELDTKFHLIEIASNLNKKYNKMYKNTKQINVTYNESWLQIFKLILFWGFIIPGTIERKLRNSKLGSTSFSGKKTNDISKFAVLFSGWEKPVREEYLVSPVPSLSWLNVIRFPMKMMTAASRFTFLWGRESPWGSRLCWMTLYLRYLLVVVGRTVNFPRD